MSQIQELFKSEFKPFEADLKPESDKAQGNYDKPKVIIKEVSSHPEYDPDKIDDMAFVYETFLKAKPAELNILTHCYLKD